MDASDLADIGVQRSPSDQVKALADLVISAGIDGLVCSPREFGELRKQLGASPLLVTPGIRLPGGNLGDQNVSPRPAQLHATAQLIWLLAAQFWKLPIPQPPFGRFATTSLHPQNNHRISLSILKTNVSPNSPTR